MATTTTTEVDLKEVLGLWIEEQLGRPQSVEMLAERLRGLLTDGLRDQMAEGFVVEDEAETEAAGDGESYYVNAK